MLWGLEWWISSQHLHFPSTELDASMLSSSKLSKLFTSKLSTTNMAVANHTSNASLLQSSLGDITNLSGSSSGSVTSAKKIVVGPFVTHFLNRRIKVCAGYKSTHPKDPAGENLPPPNDLCILHKQSRSLTPKLARKQANPEMLTITSTSIAFVRSILPFQQPC